MASYTVNPRAVTHARKLERGRQIGTWRTYDRAGRVVKETEFEG